MRDTVISRYCNRWFPFVIRLLSLSTLYIAYIFSAIAELVRIRQASNWYPFYQMQLYNLAVLYHFRMKSMFNEKAIRNWFG